MNTSLLPAGRMGAASPSVEEILSLPSEANTGQPTFFHELNDALSKGLSLAAGPQTKTPAPSVGESAGMSRAALSRRRANHDCDEAIHQPSRMAASSQQKDGDLFTTADDIPEDSRPVEEDDSGAKTNKEPGLQCQMIIPVPFPAVREELPAAAASAGQAAGTSSGAGTTPGNTPDGLLQISPSGGTVIESKAAIARTLASAQKQADRQALPAGSAPARENAAGQECAKLPSLAILEPVQPAASATAPLPPAPERNPGNEPNSPEKPIESTVFDARTNPDFRFRLSVVREQMTRTVDAGTVVAPGDEQMKMPLSAQAGASTTENPVALTISEDTLRAAIPETRRSESHDLAHVRELAGLSDSPSVTPHRLQAEPVLETGRQPSSPALRIVPIIFHEVAMLRQMNGSSMVVMIKPDADTQLMVRLDYQDGQLQASAKCERGDYNALQSHWPDLRRALESQGVRLMDLDYAADAGAGHGQGTGHFSRRQDEPLPFTGEEDATPAPVRPQPATTNLQTLPHLAGAYRLLESWA